MILHIGVPGSVLYAVVTFDSCHVAISIVPGPSDPTFFLSVIGLPHNH